MGRTNESMPKIKKTETHIERNIITGMIVSKEYMNAIHSLYKPEYILSEYARIVAGWCMNYYRKYKDVPNKTIEEIFRRYSEKEEGDVVDLITTFLTSISEEYERKQFNAPYLITQTVEYFRKRQITILSDDLRLSLEAGRIEDAEEAIRRFHSVEQESDLSFDPLDPEVIEAAFEDSPEPLFKLPGAVGELMNPTFHRSGFVALMGPEKRGKSFWLQEFVIRAGAAGNNVAVFEAGDMTKNDWIRRLAVKLSATPVKHHFCNNLLIPLKDCRLNQHGTCGMSERTSTVSILGLDGEELSYSEATEKGYVPCEHCRKENLDTYIGATWYKTKNFDDVLDKKTAIEHITKFQKQQMRSKRIRISFHPSGTLTVKKIEQSLDRWEQLYGFIPDVLVIDYADLLAADNHKEFRHQQNQIWQDLRAVSQSRSVLILTATQAGRGAYNKSKVESSDTSEDKRKLAHVTALFGLNQTPEEKRKQEMRVGAVVVREDDFDIDKQAVVMQCLPIGKVIVGSYWYVPKSKKDKEKAS